MMAWGLFLSLSISGFPAVAAPVDATVASKTFTESYLLGEIAAQILEERGMSVSRKLGMGGTGILFEGLKKGAIDVYPEYTGTIAEAILKRPGSNSIAELRSALAPLGLTLSDPLGFDNTYALAVSREFAERHHLRSMSDLRPLAPSLRVAFSHEFMTRADGYRAMRRRYGFAFGAQVRGVEHSLAYEAIGRGECDLIDVYSTDAKIEKMQLQVLVDDLHFFPRYEAVWLARRDWTEEHPDAWQLLRSLEGKVNSRQMTHLNAEADLEHRSFATIASHFLGRSTVPDSSVDGIRARVVRRTVEHLQLVGVALLFSVCMGIPLGVVAARSRALGQVILLLSSVVQTIPSLALLSFLIPFFGIGTLPALIALCLYGLLPVVVNTFVGIRSIDPRSIETARALGLSSFVRLSRIEIPLASRSLLAGVKTSAIVSIGTATLAALIGAGGYGAPILTGLALNDIGTILIGAIPAALLALFMHGLFEVLTHLLVPRGLR